jgi:hypothetical protein
MFFDTFPDNPRRAVAEFLKQEGSDALPFTMYRKFGGEIESREVEQRVSLSLEQRRSPELEPFKHTREIIPPNDAILRFLPKSESEAANRREIREKVQYVLANHPEALVPKFKLKDGKVDTDKYGRAKPIAVRYDFGGTPVAVQAAKGIRDKDARRAASAQALADRLVEYAKEVDKNPAVAAGRGWYSMARTKIKNVFGDDALLFAELLAATSPQTPVEDNFTQALEAYNQFKSGVFDAKVAKFHEGRDMLKAGTLKPQVAAATGVPVEKITDAAAMDWWIETHNLTPTKLNGKRFKANSLHVLKVMAGVWRQEAQGLKAPQFASNLSGTDMNATIDVWAARTTRRLGYEGAVADGTRWRILAEHETGVTDKDFLFAQEVFRRAAVELGMDPDSLQALVWFGEKDLYEKRGWTKSVAGKAKSDFASQLDTLTRVPAATDGGFQPVVRAAERGQAQLGFDPLALVPKKEKLATFEAKAKPAAAKKEATAEFKFLPKELAQKAEPGYISGMSEIDRVKSGKIPGVTLGADLKERQVSGPLDIVTLASVNVKRSELDEATVRAFRDQHKELFQKFPEQATLGLFDLGNDVISIDLNVIVPQSQREVTLRFARANNQAAIWDANIMDVVPTGGTGETTIKTPADALKAAAALVLGEDGFGRLLAGKAFVAKEASVRVAGALKIEEKMVQKEEDEDEDSD